MPAKTITKKVVAAAPAAPKKKVTAKKAVQKKKAVAPHACPTCRATVSPEQAFWVNNGPVVDTLLGLKQALQEMSDEQYAYHTERAGNDFAAWVRDCLGDTTCAVRIAKAKTKTSAAQAITCLCIS